MAFYNTIHAKYPSLTIISSIADIACLPNPRPAGKWMNYHGYNQPANPVGQFNMFDNIDRAFPYFIGEYSRWSIAWPDMQGSVAEAVFILSLERNSDIVKMASYAPLLQLVNSTQ
jgi:alpha-N-arabinofuranosidase